MALRDSMRASATPYLQPGEQIQAVAGAQTQSQWVLALFGIVFLLSNNYRMIVATSHRILILDTGKMSMKKAKGVVGEAPRSTRLGPTSGALWHVVDLNGEKLRVHRRFFKDIDQADAAVAG